MALALLYLTYLVQYTKHTTIFWRIKCKPIFVGSIEASRRGDLLNDAESFDVVYNSIGNLE